jgi:hypothetical protein
MPTFSINVNMRTFQQTKRFLCKQRMYLEKEIKYIVMFIINEIDKILSL